MPSQKKSKTKSHKVTAADKEIAELKKIVQKNTQAMEAINLQVFKIRKFIVWTRLISVIKFLLILTPIILSIIYLPPVVKDLIEFYNEILGKLTVK